MNTIEKIIDQQPAPPTKVQRPAIFGSPPLVDGEDHKHYLEFSARVVNAVKPQDFIEELLVQDVVDLSWDIRRMRHYKSTLLSAWSWRGVQQLAAQELDEAEAEALGRDWAASYAEDMELVEEMLGYRALPYESLAGLAWAERIGVFAQFDGIIANAERRRNDALREMERRRLALATALRRATADIVEANFEEVPPDATPAQAAE
jgi:hypothetical protein